MTSSADSPLSVTFFFFFHQCYRLFINAVSTRICWIKKVLSYSLLVLEKLKQEPYSQNFFFFLKKKKHQLYI